MKLCKANILTPNGFIAGELQWSANGRLAPIAGVRVDEARVLDGRLPLVLPGFIDLHVHGGGGRDIMEGGDAISQVAQVHAQHGTTSLLATTMTAPLADLEQAFRGLAGACDAAQASPGARVLGVHLEGPYISEHKLGAQPNFARPIDMPELQYLHGLAPIRLITLAPELPGNMDVIEALVQAGFRIQIGHTQASYAETVQALSRGAGGFTHLFNAMTPLHHRSPGAVGAALAHAEFAEIIPDLVHVHPGAIRVALRAIPHLYCVTDSTSAAGMPDGEYRLGRQVVNKCLGGVRLADGTLAGSTLTMDQALRNLVRELGLGLADASRRVSTNAANYLGVADRGRLQEGAWADCVVLNRDLKLTDVLIEGKSIEHPHAG
jgi:N-acetylglucosamine-6-phosphate deacetylase